MKYFKWGLIIFLIVGVGLGALTFKFLSDDKEMYKQQALEKVESAYLDLSRNDLNSYFGRYYSGYTEEQEANDLPIFKNFLVAAGRYQSHKVTNVIDAISVNSVGFSFPIYVDVEVKYENMTTLDKFIFSGSSLMKHDIKQKMN